MLRLLGERGTVLLLLFLTRFEPGGSGQRDRNGRPFARVADALDLTLVQLEYATAEKERETAAAEEAFTYFTFPETFGQGSASHSIQIGAATNTDIAGFNAAVSIAAGIIAAFAIVADFAPGLVGQKQLDATGGALYAQTDARAGTGKTHRILQEIDHDVPDGGPVGSYSVIADRSIAARTVYRLLHFDNDAACRTAFGDMAFDYGECLGGYRLERQQLQSQRLGARVISVEIQQTLQYAQLLFGAFLYQLQYFYLLGL